MPANVSVAADSERGGKQELGNSKVEQFLRRRW
jgi:hypothetical protein